MAGDAERTTGSRPCPPRGRSRRRTPLPTAGVKAADQLAAAEVLARETARNQPALPGCVRGHCLGVERTDVGVQRRGHLGQTTRGGRGTHRGSGPTMRWTGRRDVRSAWAPGRTPSPCLPHRGRTRGRSTPAGGPAAFWSRSPTSTSTRWSSPAGPSKQPPGWPPDSRTACGSAPSPAAPGHSPPR